MRRREFMTLVGGAVASPLVAYAQQPAKIKRIAIVFLSASNTNSPTLKRAAAAFFDELKRAGFVDGKTLSSNPTPLRGGLTALPR
jgi:putative tryptophan/tyrosine transport system substrate-binding protein